MGGEPGVEDERGEEQCGAEGGDFDCATSDHEIKKYGCSEEGIRRMGQFPAECEFWSWSATGEKRTGDIFIGRLPAGAVPLNAKPTTTEPTRCRRYYRHRQ